MTNRLRPLQNNSIELIIFDCDGVLVDSEDLSKQQLLSMLTTLGADVSPSYFDQHFLGLSYQHVQAKVQQDFGVLLSADFQQQYHVALMDLFAAKLQATLGLTTLLDQLNLPSCVATSSTPERVAHALDVTQLASYFNGRVFTAAEVPRGKPAPDLFLHAAARLGYLPENCLVIEDSPAGISAAIAAQMQVIQYRGASHLKHKPYDLSNDLPATHCISHWQQLTILLPKLISTDKH
ncbi:HAD family hydrolase [Rheinheimera sp. UJ51]|uniref:HAD family hydrolase n=1 Tax=Rheinheimera sp. UJ51 TaxID=2892446 RepID=UPI001E31A9D8|nr:HAD family hydrolase [Rheinheimera sp. UJ51]MCC5451324.1 HAD family hydrolase [Rheinheimera sp. UJ51]